MTTPSFEDFYNLLSEFVNEKHQRSSPKTERVAAFRDRDKRRLDELAQDAMNERMYVVLKAAEDSDGVLPSPEETEKILGTLGRSIRMGATVRTIRKLGLVDEYDQLSRKGSHWLAARELLD